MCRGFETTYRVRFAAMTVGVLAVACLASRAASAGPIIHEVFYDAVGSDTGQVFTEIYGETGMSLSGWSLVGINGSGGSPYRTIDLTGAVIPADSLLVIAQSSATPLLAGLRDFVANVDWQNGPDAVQFLDPWGGLADALQYGDAGLHNAGEGTFAFDAAAGSSLTRDLLGSDTNDNGIDFPRHPIARSRAAAANPQSDPRAADDTASVQRPRGWLLVPPSPRGAMMTS